MQLGKEKLRNITVVIDRNNIQIDGFTENIMPLEPLRQKFESFNLHVLEVDGHSIEDITRTFKESQTIYEKPTVILAHTIPGKGVEDFEWDYKWHGMPPNKEQGEAALKELLSFGGRVHN
jgi:transketolase